MIYKKMFKIKTGNSILTEQYDKMFLDAVKNKNNFGTMNFI